MLGGSILGAMIGLQFDGTPVPMIAGFAAAGLVSIIVILWTEHGKLFRPQMGS
jgi:MFS transporter, DHA1 family, multidrug resistance protein